MENFKLDDLETICNRSVERVPVPEWNRWVFIRTISAAERDAFDARSVQRRGDDVTTNLQNYRARLSALCMCEEGGAVLFADPEAGAVKIGQSDSKAVQRLFDVACRVNGIGQGEVDAAVKNSESEQTSGSGSGSQSNSESQTSSDSENL